MASQIIGRATCPECGFHAAHVKQSEKCHYRFCPECGVTTHMKTPRQVADLLAKTRLEAPVGGPTPSEGAPAPKSADPATPSPPPAPSATAAKPRRHGLFT